MRNCISQSRNLATSQSCAKSRREWSADSHIYLRPDQFRRLKRPGVTVSGQIYAACERYAAGDLVLIHDVAPTRKNIARENGKSKRGMKNEKLPQKRDSDKKCSFVAVHIRKRPDYPDAVIRDILDAHFRRPVNHGAEIAKLDAEIEAMFPKGEYILENEK